MSNLASQTVTGGLVDKSLEQTRRAGLMYAVVPLPWMEDWAVWAGQKGGSSFPWWDCCGLPGWDFTQEYDKIVDDDGNIRLCLLEPQHEGECA